MEGNQVGCVYSHNGADAPFLPVHVYEKYQKERRLRPCAQLRPHLAFDALGAGRGPNMFHTSTFIQILKRTEKMSISHT